MLAKFYNCQRDERYVFKIQASDQTNTEPVDIQMLTDNNNVTRPIIRVQTGRLGKKTNYVWLADLERFYFIRSWSMENGYINMHLEVDVLQTYGHQLMDSKAMVARNEFKKNAYIPDGNIKLLAPTMSKINSDWKTPFNDSNSFFYLAVVSSHGAESEGE